MDDLRKHNIPLGDYMFPKANSMKEMGSPEFLEKYKQGPVGMITIMKSGITKYDETTCLYGLSIQLLLVFLLHMLQVVHFEPGAHYLSVFRFMQE